MIETLMVRYSDTQIFYLSVLILYYYLLFILNQEKKSIHNCIIDHGPFPMVSNRSVIGDSVYIKNFFKNYYF